MGIILVGSLVGLLLGGSAQEAPPAVGERVAGEEAKKPAQPVANPPAPTRDEAATEGAKKATSKATDPATSDPATSKDKDPAASKGASPAAPGAEGDAAATPADPDGADESEPVSPRFEAPIRLNHRLDVMNYSVVVKLKTGRRFYGVVAKDPVFARRIKNNEHLGTVAYELEEPFDLRYVDGLDGQVTLQWDQIEQLIIRDSFDSSGLVALQRARSAGRLRPQQAFSKVEESSKPQTLAEAQNSLPELLVKFPPEEGWSDKRVELVEWRQSVLGVEPDLHEAEFLRVFDPWSREVEQWRKLHGTLTISEAVSRRKAELANQASKPEDPGAGPVAKADGTPGTGEKTTAPSKAPEAQSPEAGQGSVQQILAPEKKGARIVNVPAKKD